MAARRLRPRTRRFRFRSGRRSPRGVAVSGEAFLLNPNWINGSEPLLAALGAAFLVVAAAAALGSLDAGRWALGLPGASSRSERSP